MIHKRISRRTLIESLLAVVAGVNLLLTALWREWIEVLFRVDPDGGSGSLERALLVGSSVAFALFVGLAARGWRRTWLLHI